MTRAKRRVWMRGLASDTSMSDQEKKLAITREYFDRHGYVLIDVEGEMSFKPKPQHAAVFA